MTGWDKQSDAPPPPTAFSRSPARATTSWRCSRSTRESGSVKSRSGAIRSTTTCRGRTVVATMGDRAVTAVDASGEVTQIETGVLGPSHFAAANGELYVSCSAGDALAVIDSERLTLVDRVAVGAEPHEVAVAPDGDRLYSGSRREGVVDVVDTERHERIGAIDAGPDARVQGVALSPDGDRGYAVDQRGARVVAFETGDNSGSLRRRADPRRGRGRRRPVRPRRDR